MEGNDMKRAMDAIRRVLMQINQCNRDTDMEKEIQEYQCYLGMLALEINKPAGDCKLLKSIMETIEGTYKESEEYLLLKAKILLEANECRQVIILYNILEKKRSGLSQPWNERLDVIQEKIKERGNKDRKNRLISYSNQIRKNLFEKDEDIIEQLN
jgi:hypothetical protein